MKEYWVKHCNGGPDWSYANTAEIAFPAEPTEARVSACAQLCYDHRTLYVRLRAQEQHIRAELTGPTDEVCEDSCLEFFFSPVCGDPRYINIECNPNGCLYVGIGPNAEQLTRLMPGEHPIAPQAKRIPGGWETVYEIPHSFIRQHFPDFAPVPGYKMHGNFYKCGDLTVIPHYLCWSPVPMQPFAFHNPNCFGTIVFK